VKHFFNERAIASELKKLNKNVLVTEGNYVDCKKRLFCASKFLIQLDCKAFWSAIHDHLLFSKIKYNLPNHQFQFISNVKGSTKISSSTNYSFAWIFMDLERRTFMDFKI